MTNSKRTRRKVLILTKLIFLKILFHKRRTIKRMEVRQNTYRFSTMSLFRERSEDLNEKFYLCSQKS